MTESPDASELADTRLEELETAAVQFCGEAGEGKLSGVLTRAEVAWDAMIVWNALRPDQTEGILHRFGQALEPVVLRLKGGKIDTRGAGSAISQRVLFYRELASIGAQAASGGAPVQLEALRNSHKRQYAGRGGV